MTNTLTHTIGTAGRLAILSREELERLDAAALEVLAEVGVSIPSEKARAALAAQGAAVDGARVRLRPELVRRLVDLAPPTWRPSRGWSTPRPRSTSAGRR